jgi:hypothetical protein
LTGDWKIMRFVVCARARAYKLQNSKRQRNCRCLFFAIAIAMRHTSHALRAVAWNWNMIMDIVCRWRVGCMVHDARCTTLHVWVLVLVLASYSVYPLDDRNFGGIRPAGRFFFCTLEGP